MRLDEIIHAELWGSPCRQVGKEKPTGEWWKLRHREHGLLELLEPLSSRGWTGARSSESGFRVLSLAQCPFLLWHQLTPGIGILPVPLA